MIQLRTIVGGGLTEMEMSKIKQRVAKAQEAVGDSLADESSFWGFEDSIAEEDGSIEVNDVVEEGRIDFRVDRIDEVGVEGELTK